MLENIPQDFFCEDLIEAHWAPDFNRDLPEKMELMMKEVEAKLPNLAE